MYSSGLGLRSGKNREEGGWQERYILFSSAKVHALALQNDAKPAPSKTPAGRLRETPYTLYLIPGSLSGSPYCHNEPEGGKGCPARNTLPFRTE